MTKKSFSPLIFFFALNNNNTYKYDQDKNELCIHFPSTNATMIVKKTPTFLKGVGVVACTTCPFLCFLLQLKRARYRVTH